MAGDRSEFVPIPDNFFTGKDCRNVTKICSHSRSCRSFLVCHTEVWNYVVFKFLYFTLPRGRKKKKKNGNKKMMNESRAEKILIEVDRNCFTFIIYFINDSYFQKTGIYELRCFNRWIQISRLIFEIKKILFYTSNLYTYFYTDLKYFVIHIHNSFRGNYAILICFLIEN